MSTTFRSNWFWPLCGCLALAAWIATRGLTVADARIFEAALTFDVLVTIPALYALCYWRVMKRSHLIVRMVGLQCLGVWLASHTVAQQAQVVLPHLEPLRLVGIAVLVLIEIRLAVVVLRMVFRSGTSVHDLEREGVPPLIARLMLIEARFWKWVLSIFRK